LEPFTFVELSGEVPDAVLEQGTRGSSLEEVCWRRWTGDGAQGARALPWVAAVARRGLAARVGDDGRAGAGGSSTMVVQVAGKETRRARGGLRNTKARPVGTKEHWRSRTTWRQGAQLARPWWTRRRPARKHERAREKMSEKEGGGRPLGYPRFGGRGEVALMRQARPATRHLVPAHSPP